MTLQEQIKRLEIIANDKFHGVDDSTTKLAKEAISIIKKQEQIINRALLGLEASDSKYRSEVIAEINKLMEQQ